MNLGTKINLMLVAITAVVLSLGFFVSTLVDSRGIERQILTDADAVTDILRSDIERTLGQAYPKQERLRIAVAELAKISNVTEVSVLSSTGFYVTSSRTALVGTRATEKENALLLSAIKNGKASAVNNQKTFFEFEERIPVIVKGEDGRPDSVNVAKVQVTTNSKEPNDLRQAQEILNLVVASVNQNIRPLVEDIQKNFDTVVGTMANIQNIGFLRTATVFNSRLGMLASNEPLEGKTQEVVSEYQQYREDVLSGKIPDATYSRIDGEQEVLVRVLPLSIASGGKVKHIGVFETQVSTSAYKDKIETLKMRLAIIQVVFTILIVIILAIVLRKKVTDPIKKYSLIAQRVADGDFNQTVEHVSNDEIGRFGDVFNSMLANLREFDRMKSGFLSVAAHQLRTPLSGIRWVFKLLLDEDLGQLSEDQREMLKRGHETSEKMAELVDGLLNVSRIENGKFGYKLERNDIQKFMETLIYNSELTCKEHNINLRFDNRARGVAPFVFDAEKLLIAFQNIVDNAIKYTLPGGSVIVTMEQQGDYLEVKVSDTGVGIPKDEIPKLFAKFFRAVNVIHLQTEGSGLGLFIAKSIILRHGGQISVSSVEGKGTTFTMTVPLLENLIPKEEGGWKGGVGGLGHAVGTVI
ncbi:MAG: HAMP domain-containing sensor histidine kinase [Patescibacteria group bacterium]